MSGVEFAKNICDPHGLSSEKSKGAVFSFNRGPRDLGLFFCTPGDQVRPQKMRNPDVDFLSFLSFAQSESEKPPKLQVPRSNE